MLKNHVIIRRTVAVRRHQREDSGMVDERRALEDSVLRIGERGSYPVGEGRQAPGSPWQASVLPAWRRTGLCQTFDKRNYRLGE